MYFLALVKVFGFEKAIFYGGRVRNIAELVARFN